MYKLFFLLLLYLSLWFRTFARNATDSVLISGKVTDFNGQPLDSITLYWQQDDFSEATTPVLTNRQGYYQAYIPKGKYYSMVAFDRKAYPDMNCQYADKDQRLEFWAWNFIADRDTTFHIRCHRMEAYGMHVFQIPGAIPAYVIYVRPMSLTRIQHREKNKTQQLLLAPSPEKLHAKVTINGEEVSILMKQEIKEYYTPGKSLNAYLLTVAPPSSKSQLPYSIFKLVLTDLENGDQGEGVYFLEKERYHTNK